MARKPDAATGHTPQRRLDVLIDCALDVCRKAKRQRKSLSGDNFYANKLATLRTEATNCFSDLSGPSPGDTSTLAEMLARVFAAGTQAKDRLDTSRELRHSLNTTWNKSATSGSDDTADSLFPASLLSKTGRGYLISIGAQMNGAFARGWYDASAVMMRRLLETVIIEAFETKNIAGAIQDRAGNYLQLGELVDAALAQSAWRLTRNTKQALPRLRELGNLSAHSRRYTAQKPDIQRIENGARVAIEEFLHLAELL